MSHLTIRSAHIPQDLSQIHHIRYCVFQLEQGVDPALEFDDRDEGSDHLLAYWDDRPVGTLRWRLIGDATVKLERLAVLADVRQQGIGQELMVTAIATLQQQGIKVIQIHAQLTVQSFYERLGFQAIGEVFGEAGIPHVKMIKNL